MSATVLSRSEDRGLHNPIGRTAGGRRNTVNIGEAAQGSGISAKTIRYYEDIGLIAKAARSQAGYRNYSDADVHTLRFIRRARQLGFSVGQVNELLALWRNRRRSSAAVKSLAQERIAALDLKAAELMALSRALKHLADNCAGDHRPECPILDDMAESALGTDPPSKISTRAGVGRRG